MLFRRHAAHAVPRPARQRPAASGRKAGEGGKMGTWPIDSSSFGYDWIEAVPGMYVMGYRLVGIVLLLSAIFFIPVSIAAFAYPKPFFYLGGAYPYFAYELDPRWIGGWSLYASLLAYCGFRYCRVRADSRDPGRHDSFWIGFGKKLVVLGAICAVYILVSEIGSAPVQGIRIPT